MEVRNLDFEIVVTPEQWQQLGRTAAATAHDGAGFLWDERQPDEIRVLFREDDVPPRWEDYVSPPELYGARARPAARFVFNDGRPYARIEPPSIPAEPVLDDDEQEAMRNALERWVRGKWHELMRISGLHYTPGHIPQS